MKFEHTEVFNFAGALRGMRNPMESWDKSDSDYIEQDGVIIYGIGKDDLILAQKLIKAGSEHRKFMRQIFVCVDITAPLYLWKEFDTYKVGTVANSTSTMHKLASTPITIDCFEMDDFEPIIEDDKISYSAEVYWRNLIKHLEELREMYNRSKNPRIWKELIRELPDSWLQKRTVTFDYENLLAICSRGQRRFHKLTEWSSAFISWARKLPYAQELIFIDEVQKQETENENSN